MNDAKEKEQVQNDLPEDHTPAPSDPSQVLSPGRRSALVTYLAILFAVAFLFVALTMSMESKRLKMMNEALENSSQKTSASLTSSITALQEENRTLSSDKEELSAQLTALEEELEQLQNTAKEDQKKYSTKMSQLNEKIRTLETDKTELNTQIEALTKKVEHAVTVSELLQQAIELDDDGNMTELEEVLKQIEPFKDLLSPSELEIYESLTVD